MGATNTQMPRIGFGTWQITGSPCVEAVRDALDVGYRHIDTARVYDNEREVGRAIGESGVPRAELFVTTKVWMDDLEPARLRHSAEGSLDRLGMEHVDLLLIHWPSAQVPLEQSIEEMLRLREEGKTREIGVSNFPPPLMRRALELGPIFANQVEYHPLLGQEELLAICRDAGCMLTAYAPFAHGKVLAEPVLREIGEAHGKSAAQVALRWLLDQPQVAVVPKAASPERRRENLDVVDFELSDDERRWIDALPKDRREFDPGWAPDWEA